MQQLLSCVCQSTILKRGKNRILNAAEILGEFMSNSVIGDCRKQHYTVTSKAEAVCLIQKDARLLLVRMDL